jgi:alpha-1,3-rhamnosyl/mannosyltransferase
MLPLLTSMAQAYPAVEFHVWVDAKLPELSNHANVRQYPVNVANRFLARVLLQATLPLESSRRRFDIVHFMKNLVVEGVSGRRIVTIHDLHPLFDPAIYPASDVFYWRRIQPLALARVDRVIAISRRTANDLIQAYGVIPEIVDVVYHGIDSGFRPRAREEIAPTLERLGIGASYILHVGAISAKKNLASLIRAFAIVKAAGYPGQLVLVGPQYEKLERVPLAQIARDAGVAEWVNIAGALTSGDVQDVMAGAELFVFPSMYEGFGLVVLEAMASGVPVVAARAGAVAEIVGDVAPVVEDGSDHVNLARQMGDLLADDARRQAVARACIRHAERFTWEIAARGTMRVYEKSLDRAAAAS